ncbi:di-trans,poly-cis-decaprenylcistransferase [Tremella mesenterica]|uniref:Alkyl transferase n=1 Tax=Tremella mesenterica TaxID=5217 RepID=A0A4Q1BAE4_TREME|nr:di-trans,poly-cis-decaprenylcistransferase [Tremella mesenterica]
MSSSVIRGQSTSRSSERSLGRESKHSFFQLRLSELVHRVHGFLTSLLIFIISLGPLPRHVGFVMDGNRRYARGRGKRAVQGHTDGFTSLRRVLQICLRLNIPVVTIFAFSIENFNRPKEEVDALMNLAKSRLMELCTHGDLLQIYGVRIRFIGNLDMLPADVREAARKMEALTADNDRGLLNVASPYTSRDEITTAVRDTVVEMRGVFLPDVVSTETVFENLQTSRAISRLDKGGDGKVDILVRTSGVQRLSDFLMWQCCEDTQIHFVRTHWPEFGLTDMLPILLGWQQKVWMSYWGI